MKKITVSIDFTEVPLKTPVMLPQADIIKGVTGSFLVIQIQDKQYSVAFSDMVSFISFVADSAKDTTSPSSNVVLETNEAS